jgi:DNA topoisomerase-1
VKDYLRESAGGPFTAKVFRTWAGSVTALALLADEPVPATATAAKWATVEAVKQVAAELGNTPAVCRASYIHPRVLTAFAAGELPAARKPPAGLTAAEGRLLRLLRG